MGAADQSPVFKAGKVAANAGSRGAGDCKDFFTAGCTYAQQKVDDVFAASVQGIGHDANDCTRRMCCRKKWLDHSPERKTGGRLVPMCGGRLKDELADRPGMWSQVS